MGFLLEALLCSNPIKSVARNIYGPRRRTSKSNPEMMPRRENTRIACMFTARQPLG